MVLFWNTQCLFTKYFKNRQNDDIKLAFCKIPIDIFCLNLKKITWFGLLTRSTLPNSPASDHRRKKQRKIFDQEALFNFCFSQKRNYKIQLIHKLVNTLSWRTKIRPRRTPSKWRRMTVNPTTSKTKKMPWMAQQLT